MKSRNNLIQDTNCSSSHQSSCSLSAAAVRVAECN